jgi:hypothetical protein
LGPLGSAGSNFGLSTPYQRVFVGARDNTVTLRAARLTDDPAGLAFREIIFAPNGLNSLPAPLGAYK